MKEEEKASLREATTQLKLIDVVLVEARLSRPQGTAALSWAGEALQEHKRAVSYGKGDGEIDGRALTMANFEIELGTRVVKKDSAGDTQRHVVVEIEARFLVLYEVGQAISDEAMALFAKINAVHIVWPFWRQHVFDLVQRAHLPRLEIPLLAGTMP
jgi:hypothetical protein